MLDNEATPGAAPGPKQSPQRADSDGPARSTPKKPTGPKEESPFMHELARVRSDLHKEHRARIALEEEAEALRREGASLQRQMVALQEQRHELQTARFDLELQLDEEQRRRELLVGQIDAINTQLATARSRRKKVAAELAAARRECKSLKCELEAVNLSYEVAADELRAKLRSLAFEREHAARDRDALQATALEQQSEIAALMELTKNADAAVLLPETLAANECLESRVSELEAELAAKNRRLEQGRDASEAVNERVERLQNDVAKLRMELAESHEQLAVARLRLASADRDREHSQQREAEAAHRADELSDEVKSLQASVQREAAARRKAESVHKGEAGNNDASALFEAELRIERLSRELAASRSVEFAYQQKAARKVQQVKQELDSVRQRLAEFEQRPEAS